MYLRRLIENSISEALETSGVVVVAGPKFCGKTTTCLQFAKSKYILDTKPKIQFAQSDPAAILAGKAPRLIDEWQTVPDLWNQARTIVDRRKSKFGQFLFTGSSTPADMDDIFHSGAGRIVTVAMKPMSLYESLESRGSVSLDSLFGGQEKVSALNEGFSASDTAFYICRGGWPLSVSVSDRRKALKVTENYFSTLFEFENSKNNEFRNKKPEILKMVLKSYARNISTEARRGRMLSDINSNDDRSLDKDTFDNYHKALVDLFIIKDIEAWNPNLRSQTAIITTPTRHFVDTSIATNALGISPEDLINDPKSFGFFFEDLAVRDLSIYSQAIGGEVRHYRDGNGLECDAVIHLKNGKYALVEIKLGGQTLINQGVSSLLSLRRKITDANLAQPVFSMILTASGNAFTTSENIHVVPINMLRP